ncbi:MAG: isoprenylcysteine carboxylmethyltransferase family protein [Anaerolineae bacterium]|nr:isoprenylcysteine carboxylmethyltransferase family protein [Anaerolineae bacterium]
MTENMAAGVRRWLVKEIVFVGLLMLLLFGGAGRLDWGTGWVLVALFVLQQVATGIGLWRVHPSLLAERADAHHQEGVKSWDLPLARFGGVLLPMLTWLVAGLDTRLGWTAPLPGWLVVGGGVVMVLGMALTTWAMIANAFFSGVVRIQRDRGHQVAAGGPYRIVRHPGYLGAILYDLGAPLLLGSWWALLPSGLAIVLMTIRTALEDRTLRAELEGYAAYTQQTRWRLLPGVW